MSLFGPDAEDSRKILVTAESVAELPAAVALVPVTAYLLRKTLARSVDAARYWQPPGGTDVTAGSVPARAQLARVAEHLAASGLASWWVRAATPSDQWFTDGVVLGDEEVAWEYADANSEIATWSRASITP